jgi:hypothetical protein
MQIEVGLNRQTETSRRALDDEKRKTLLCGVIHIGCGGSLGAECLDAETRI